MTRRQMLALLATVPLLSFLQKSRAFGADPKTEPLITITKTDGTLVRGKLISCDGSKITIGVATKPTDAPVNTEISWDDIKRVSSGLTRETARAKFNSENGDKLCITCHGDGKVYCPTCHGTAHDPAAGKDCPKCKGTEQITCITPHCDKGTIPCPRTCLKASDPGWYTKPDGSKWKKFVFAHGYNEWSEHHIGELIVKTAQGTYESKGKCPTCAGTTTVADPACHGIGERPCVACTQRKDAAICPNKCVVGFVTCDKCKGSGLKV